MKKNSMVLVALSAVIPFAMISPISVGFAAPTPEVTYRHQLGIPMADGSVELSYVDHNDIVWKEWAVVKLNNDRREFSVYHTSKRNRGLGRHWFDHPVTAMKICLTDGFDISDCKVVQSDTAQIPEGRTIHDLSIEIKYSESGRDRRRSFILPRTAKPE